MTDFVELDSEIAARVAPHAMLLDVMCVEVRAQLIEDPPAYAMRFDLEPCVAVWGQRPDGVWTVAFPFSLRLLGQDAESDTAEREFGTIRVVLIGVYQLKPEAPKLDTDALVHYLGVSGTLHVWPYLRAEVQRLTATLRIPTLTLPVIMSDAARQLTRISPTPAMTAAPITDPATD
jgi:hypothetical protein